MYLLHAPAFPKGSWSTASLGKAWDVKVLGPFPKVVGPVDAKRAAKMVKAVLTGRGEAVPQKNGDFEVPRSSRKVLEALESFYAALYPEAKGSPDLSRFHFEEVEWLGEF